ncbi:uncharacterized protein L201_003072 [Kwoniella dendrophila CBS 6074]|uniref:Uncharacterized protein n=1 Tax=Kwoniella dendrophila CBS 6074 TaxID=1295534 RepID=A0AAX4JUD8_9TREE
MISGLKMQETFQLNFLTNEDVKSFTKLLDGFFSLVESAQKTKIRNQPGGEGQSQIPLSSPSKMTIINDTPQSSPTKSSKSIASSPSKRTSSSQKRSGSNSPKKKDNQEDSQSTTAVPISTTHNKLKRRSSEVLRLGGDITPSPPKDDATERLKKALLGNFRPSPPIPDQQRHEKETTPPSPSKASNDNPLERGISNNIDQIDHTAVEPELHNTNLSPQLGRNHHSPQTQPHNMNNTLPEQNKETVVQDIPIPELPAIELEMENPQPLIVFSPCLEAVHLSQIGTGTQPDQQNSDLHQAVEDEEELEQLLASNNPIMLTNKEAEAMRINQSKRKFDELEEEWEEESQERSQRRFWSDTPFTTPASNDDGYPKLPYGRGVYDLASPDLEKLVDEVIMEKGFEMLVTKIESIVKSRLEVVSNQETNFVSPPQGFHQPPHLPESGLTYPHHSHLLWGQSYYHHQNHMPFIPDPDTYRRHPTEYSHNPYQPLHLIPQQSVNTYMEPSESQEEYLTDPMESEPIKDDDLDSVQNHNNLQDHIDRLRYYTQYPQHTQNGNTYQSGNQNNHSQSIHDQNITQPAIIPEITQYDQTIQEIDEVDTESYRELYGTENERPLNSLGNTQNQLDRHSYDNSNIPTHSPTDKLLYSPYREGNSNEDEEEEDIANISREFDNGIFEPPETLTEEPEYNYDYEDIEWEYEL